MGLVALLAVLPCAHAATGGPFQVAFAVPAQAAGELEVRGSHWALILFRDAPALLDADLGAASASNHTRWMAQDTHGGSVNVPVPVPPAGAEFAEGIHGTLESGAPWASLYVEAASIVLATTGAATLRQAEAGRYASAYLPAVDRPGPAVDAPLPEPSAERRVPEAGVAIAFEGARRGDSFPFSLRAEGVTRLAWHNLTLACAVACPMPSSGPGGMGFAIGDATRVQRLSYIEVAAPTGILQGAGRALAAATGAGTLDLAVNGTLRLPLAKLTGECPDGPCVDPKDGTFLTNLTGLLAGLKPQPSLAGARMQGQASGEFHDSRFDEAPAPGFTPEEAVVVGAVVVVGGGAALLLLALFARSARAPALRHPRRQALLQAIRERPGLSTRGLERHLGWSRGTLLFHLRRLVEDGHVAAQPYKNTVRHFEAHGVGLPAWRRLVQVLDPAAGRLHAWLLDHPGADQAGIVREAQAWGWDRNKVRRQLRSLECAGLLDRQPAGRRVQYRVRDGNGDGPPPVGASA